MKHTPEQSRKIALVEIPASAQSFFEEALTGHDLSFSRSLSSVPTDTEILSVFVSEKLDEEILLALPELKLIAARSTASDYIDLEACRRLGIAVAHAGSYGENSVAEHTFALMLALSRRLRESENAVARGRFDATKLRGFDLRGKTLGVIGAGRVGLHVIRIGCGFGMKVLAHDSSPHPFFSELLDFQYVNFEELLTLSDVISLHVPLNEATLHMINEQSLAKCKDNLILINTARGALVDTAAVTAALDNGRIAGLGLDVLEDERVFHGGATALLGQQIAERVRSSQPAHGGEATPSRLSEFSKLVAHNSLLKRPNVILTPHVAYNSEEAAERLQTITLEHIQNFLAGKPLDHRLA
jgi:D-lactate dehydrogenase